MTKDLTKETKIYITNNECIPHKEIISEYKGLVEESNLEILKDHIGDQELSKFIYSFFEDNGNLHVGIGSLTQSIEYLEIKKK